MDFSRISNGQVTLAKVLQVKYSVAGGMAWLEAFCQHLQELCVHKTKLLLRTAEEGAPKHALLTQRRIKLIQHSDGTMEGLVDTKSNLQVHFQPKQVALKKCHCGGTVKLFKHVSYLLKGSKVLTLPSH